MHTHETLAQLCASIDESTDPLELKRICEAAVAVGEALEGATTAEGFLAYTDAFAAATVALGWLALASGKEAGAILAALSACQGAVAMERVSDLLRSGQLAIGARVEHTGTCQRGLVMRFRAPDVEVYFADIDTSDWVDAGMLRAVAAPVSP